MTVTDRRKILMLHGATQSASIFKKRMTAIERACQHEYEFVYVDAPHVLQPVDPPGVAPLENAVASTSDAPRAWFYVLADWTEAIHAPPIGLHKSMEYLRAILKADRYDGIWGFSQGAAMSGLLTALLEKPQLYPGFVHNGRPIHPPFKFYMSMSGYMIPDPLADSIFATTYSTPTLFVTGEGDIVVTEELTNRLAERAESKRVLKHLGGHYVPSKPKWQQFFREFLRDPLADLESPTTTPDVSAPNSEAATEASSSASSDAALSDDESEGSTAVDFAPAVTKKLQSRARAGSVDSTFFSATNRKLGQHWKRVGVFIS